MAKRHGDRLFSRVALRLALVAVFIAVITLLSSRLLAVNVTTVGFAYLVTILLIATKWGLTEAIAASLLAVLCYNFFFLPPVGTFTITDPQNWVALLAFLATSITASRLSDRAKQRTLEALEQRHEMEQLYALSRAILLIDPAETVARQVAQQVAQSFDAAAVVLYDGQIFHRAGPQEMKGIDEQLRQAAMQGTSFKTVSDKNEAGQTASLIAAIRLGSQPVGSLGISGVDLSDSAMQNLMNLVAIGLERAAAQEAASRAEAARQSDELKSTLLDAIAHEFKTPLTTMKASTSALLSARTLSAEDQRAYVGLIDEETGRLSGLVSDAIQMARFEAGKVRLDKQSCRAEDLIETVIASMSSVLDDRPTSVTIAKNTPALFVDPELAALALRQVVDNAAKYAPAKTPLEFSAGPQDHSVLIRVRDYGPGIPENERTRIFEKFYRVNGVRNYLPGAGLGLAIARAIVQAHGGKIWAESPDGAGALFCISLPTVSLSTVFLTEVEEHS